MKNQIHLALLLIIMILPFFVDGQGCSQCKLLAEQGSELNEASFGSNINYGILYLMIIPYLLLIFLFRKRISLFFKSLSKRKI
jgi:hypothetical protein